MKQQPHYNQTKCHSTIKDVYSDNKAKDANIGRTTTRHQYLENTKKRSYSNLKKGTVREVMKGTVTKMVDKTIKVGSAGSATVLRRRQVLALLHSEDGRRVTGIPGGTSQPT